MPVETSLWNVRANCSVGCTILRKSENLALFFVNHRKLSSSLHGNGDLQAALEQFREIAVDLGGKVSTENKVD